jgi:hypothetical protein
MKELICPNPENKGFTEILSSSLSLQTLSFTEFQRKLIPLDLSRTFSHLLSDSTYDKVAFQSHYTLAAGGGPTLSLEIQAQRFWSPPCPILQGLHSTTSLLSTLMCGVSASFPFCYGVSSPAPPTTPSYPNIRLHEGDVPDALSPTPWHIPASHPEFSRDHHSEISLLNLGPFLFIPLGSTILSFHCYTAIALLLKSPNSSP